MAGGEAGEAVPGSARPRSREKIFCESEIEDFHLSAANSKENIGGLDVAMNDAFCVSGVKRAGHLNAGVEQIV